MRFMMLILITALPWMVQARAPAPPAQKNPASAVVCVRGGCSGELCMTEKERDDLMSTCLWKEEFACKKLMDCTANSKDQCQLVANDASTQCLSKLPKNQPL